MTTRVGSERTRSARENCMLCARRGVQPAVRSLCARVVHDVSCAMHRGAVMLIVYARYGGAKYRMGNTGVTTIGVVPGTLFTPARLTLLDSNDLSHVKGLREQMP